MIKNLIRSEYSMRADILSNICNHIDNLNRDNIIYHTIRNKMMNMLSTCVLTLNTNYNDCLPLYKTMDYAPIDYEHKFINDLNFEGFNLFVSHGNNDLRARVSEYFVTVDKNIYELMGSVGSKSIADLLRLKIGDNYREIMGVDIDLNDLRQWVQENKKKFDLHNFQVVMHNSAALLDVLIKHFIPVEMGISRKVFDNEKTTILINKYKYDKIVNSEESTKFKFEVCKNKNNYSYLWIF